MKLPVENLIMDHIGIAVNSLEEGKKFYESMGFSKMYVEEVASEGVRVGMWELTNQVRIELLEPLNQESPIYKFIQKRGTGIHHVCYRVENLEKTIADLKQKNIPLINETPKPGAHNCMIAFVHPKGAGGVLVELSQPKDKA